MEYRDMIANNVTCLSCGGKLLTCGPTDGWERWQCADCGKEWKENAAGGLHRRPV